MDGRRRNTTLQQLQMLVEFAEANRDLALGRLRSKEARALSTRLWRECAEALNSEGPARLPKEWARVWNDMKSRVRCKLMSLTLSQRGTGGRPGPYVSLTSLEEKVADIIGRDIGPIPNVAQNQFSQASPEENLVEVDMYIDRHECVEVQNINIDNNDQLHVSGLSRRLSSPSAPRLSPQPSLRQASLPSSSPHRQRGRRQQRPRQRSRPRETRVGQAQSSRGELNESRDIMVRIEELRARTDHILAEAALKQADAAKVQAEAALISAEANRLQARTLDAFCQAIASFMPAARRYLETHTSRAT